MDLITLALAKKYVNKKFDEAVGFGGFKIVDELPSVNISHSTVYLLKTFSPTEGNLYSEWVYTVDNTWEQVGVNHTLTEQDKTDIIDAILSTLTASDDWQGLVERMDKTEEATTWISF